jgi:hypothetical protein
MPKMKPADGADQVRGKSDDSPAHQAKTEIAKLPSTDPQKNVMGRVTSNIARGSMETLLALQEAPPAGPGTQPPAAPQV